MEDRRSLAEQVIRKFLIAADKDADTGIDVPIFGEGLGLDSLETAELSATLEDAFGSDPFSDGLLPETIGEILDFYGDATDATPVA
jgi:acyl carrier protein